MTFVPHLMQSLGLGPITVEVIFHKPVCADKFKNRRELANYCQKLISKGVVMSYSGFPADSKPDSVNFS